MKPAPLEKTKEISKAGNKGFAFFQKNNKQRINTVKKPVKNERPKTNMEQIDEVTTPIISDFTVSNV